MIKRHIVAFLITIAVYFIPTSTICNDFLYFLVHVFLSAVYITLIYNFAKIAILPILIGIEILSIILTIPAFIYWVVVSRIIHLPPEIALFVSSKSQWFYSNFETTMLICFVAEIVVIILGAAHGGIHQLFLPMCQYIIHAIHSVKITLLASWYTLCKIISNS